MPVIRIDDDVWKQLQARAKPLVDTPNDVLRRILELNGSMSPALRSNLAEEDMRRGQQAIDGDDSIFIVVNAAGKIPNDTNANNGYRLTKRRVESGVDILAPRRFSSARKLRKGARIVMYQGGSMPFREKYGSGQLIAAGRIKEVAREFTDKDKVDYREDHELAQECFPGPFVGIVFYEFPNGMAKQPLPKEKIPYNAGRGDNFKEIKPNDPRYSNLDVWWKWWKANS